MIWCHAECRKVNADMPLLKSVLFYEKQTCADVNFTIQNLHFTDKSLLQYIRGNNQTPGKCFMVLVTEGEGENSVSENDLLIM